MVGNNDCVAVCRTIFGFLLERTILVGSRVVVMIILERRRRDEVLSDRKLAEGGGTVVFLSYFLHLFAEVSMETS